MQQPQSSSRCIAARVGTPCSLSARRPPHAQRAAARDRYTLVTSFSSSSSSSSNVQRRSSSFQRDCAAAVPTFSTQGSCHGHAPPAARGLGHAPSSRIQGPSRSDMDVIDVSMELSTDQKVQLTTAIAQTRSYLELYSLLKKCGADLDENIAVYAMLQAANLQETAQEDVLAEHDTLPQALDVIDSLNLVVDLLVPCIERHIAGYPVQIQLTLVSAMAQLGHYSESIFSSVAHSCCQLGDASGGMVQALERTEADARSSAQAVIFEPSSTASTPLLPDNPELIMQMKVVVMQLMLSSSAYALMGHYDNKLFNLIASQVVQYLEYIADMPSLINILCAFMDVDHFNRELLEKAGEKLAAEMADIQPADAASALLVYAFFRVKNPAFYERLLEVASQLDAETVDPKTAGMLYRGIRLCPDPVDIPPPVVALLERSLERFGMLELSVTSSITNPTLLDKLEEEETDEVLALLDELHLDDIAVRRELFTVLTKYMGLETERNVAATQDGWLPMHITVKLNGNNICFLVMKDGMAKIKNEEMRLRGPIRSEIRCLHQEGWIVLMMEPQDWKDHLERFGVDGDGEEEPDMDGLIEFLGATMMEAVLNDSEREDVEVE